MQLNSAIQMMPERLKKFTALPAYEKGVLIQAWFCLGWMRAAILILGVKRLAASMYRRAGAVLPTPVSPHQSWRATRIGSLVAAAAGATPWQSRCLVQVLVVQRLLAARGIPGQLCLGVSRACGVTDDLAGLSAHAWVHCGDVIVNGAAGRELYTVVSTFRWGAPCTGPDPATDRVKITRSAN